MSKATLDVQGMNIVMLGEFNPKIFQPAWFAAHGLLPESEATAAEIQIIHSDIVLYSTDWLRLHVTRDRLQAATTQEPYYEVLRDLLLGTFGLLEHTPVHSMGINSDYHYRMHSADDWHALGHKLAPKEPWGNLLTSVGLRELVMEGVRDDGFSGHKRIHVGPSTKLAPSPGLYVGVNDHYEVKSVKDALGCKEIISILEAVWDSSGDYAKQIPQLLLEGV